MLFAATFLHFLLKVAMGYRLGLLNTFAANVENGITLDTYICTYVYICCEGGVFACIVCWHLLSLYGYHGFTSEKPCKM